jgi:hypothetical protein
MPALINSVVRDAQPVQNIAGGNNILHTLFCYNQPVAIVEVKSITTTTNHGVIWPSPSFRFLVNFSILCVYVGKSMNAQKKATFLASVLL